MTALWEIFADQAAADTYADSEAAKYLPRHATDVTSRMADPLPLADGRWVVQTVDGSGVSWQPDWQRAEA